jgi:PhoD-like phosphatase
VTGTIDDHDYGTNNGDINYKYKRESAMAFVDFLGEPPSSPMSQRARDGHGVYGVKLIDFDRPFGSRVLTEEEAGIDPDSVGSDNQVSYSNKSVAIFVLDIRSFKTPWSEGRDRFRINPEGDFLGERQWHWLEKALKRSKAAVHVVVQGLQVHADRYPDGNVAENWSKFPRAQDRLYDLLLQHEAPTILVSGDVHMAELMRKDCKSGSSIKSLVEVTTSGLTHSWGTRYCSRPSFSYLCRNSYANWVFRNGMHFAHYINPLNDVIISDEGKMQYSLQLNFAEFEFDWDKHAINVSILGREGVSLLNAKWSFDEFKRGLPGSKVRDEDYLAKADSQAKLGLPQTQWQCVNYRGVAHPYHVYAGIVATWMFPMFFFVGPMIAALVLGTMLAMRRRRKK